MDAFNTASGSFPLLSIAHFSLEAMLMFFGGKVKGFFEYPDFLNYTGLLRCTSLVLFLFGRYQSINAGFLPSADFLGHC